VTDGNLAVIGSKYGTAWPTDSHQLARFLQRFGLVVACGRLPADSVPAVLFWLLNRPPQSEHASTLLG